MYHHKGKLLWMRLYETIKTMKIMNNMKLWCYTVHQGLMINYYFCKMYCMLKLYWNLIPVRSLKVWKSIQSSVSVWYKQWNNRHSIHSSLSLFLGWEKSIAARSQQLQSMKCYVCSPLNCVGTKGSWLCGGGDPWIDNVMKWCLNTGFSLETCRL